MDKERGSFTVKKGLAQMLKGGVIMDVVTPEHARIAEEAGACAVMALERVPADIRAQGGVARMSDPAIIQRIMETVTIPVMAKCRIGHFVEAQVLEAIGVDFIDESEVLTPADEEHHILKHPFGVPFVCGARNLGEALRRIGEGAAMIRTKGEAGTTPADAALMMQLGLDGVFVGSGIFKSGDPAKRGAAIVKAVTHFREPHILAEVSRDLGEPMVGRQISAIPKEELIAGRGW
ncbi:MAG: pyridoxal 5'-phosphate synthase lyase subunit PdxS [Chloroflexi bacterium]|nr:pyridoxal 5'-phosphate synthase lyase subunit PdxS [Chloroflexota bacterium]